jgi:hypothetical protein
MNGNGKMLTIIQVEKTEQGMHRLQAQSGRTESWLEGWIPVPEELEAEAWACAGWCDLTVENGVLTGIAPTERPIQPEPEAEPTPQEDGDALLVDHECRLTLLELGLTEEVN